MASAPGKPSALHPGLGMTWKRALKIERIARFSLDPACYSNAQIANVMGCTEQTIVLIRQLPAYHAKVLELLTGLTSEHDRELRQDTDAMKDELKSMMPSSMMVIRNALLSKNENIRIKAAFEVMDREGTLAKVSKSSVAVEVKPAMQVDPRVAGNLIALLAGAPQNGGGAEINATTGGFTIQAGAAAIQDKDMAESNDMTILDSIDLSNQKPN